MEHPTDAMKATRERQVARARDRYGVECAAMPAWPTTAMHDAAMDRLHMRIRREFGDDIAAEAWAQFREFKGW